MRSRLSSWWARSCAMSARPRSCARTVRCSGSFLPGRGALPSGCATGRACFRQRDPRDFDAYAEKLRRNLSEPGRFASVRGMMLGPSRREIEARLSRLDLPVLVLMGTKDRDFKDPAAEAQLVAERAHGAIEMIEGAGHYPHVEFPERTAKLIVEFALQADGRCRDSSWHHPLTAGGKGTR